MSGIVMTNEYAVVVFILWAVLDGLVCNIINFYCIMNLPFHISPIFPHCSFTYCSLMVQFYSNNMGRSAKAF